MFLPNWQKIQNRRVVFRPEVMNGKQYKIQTTTPQYQWIGFELILVQTLRY